MTEEIIKVLIVDDHPLLRHGLATQIEVEPGMVVVGEAIDGETAIKLVQEIRPDVIIMDLLMPGMDGIQAIREIKQENQETRILVLTSASDDEKVTQAIQAGALGYILKDTTPEELIRVIHEIYEGIPALSAVVTKRIINRIRNMPEVNKSSPLSELTSREIEVFLLLAHGKSNQEISKMLFIGSSTVRSHVSNIMQKLGLENRSQVVLFALKAGIIKT